MKTAAVSGSCLILPDALVSHLKSGQLSDHRKQMLFGWTTCLTYQTGERKLGYEYYSNLLEAMKAHGMRRLMVMMESHGVYSPGNHGIAWPVKNPKLQAQMDKNALNADEESEFFSQVITKAHRLGIEVFIEVKYLGMAGIRASYPGVKFITKADGSFLHSADANASPSEKEAVESMHVCCDSEIAHQYMRDKLRDVLERYNNLDGVVLEHPSYFGDKTCYCAGSQARLLQDTGKRVDEIDDELLIQWKNRRVRDTLINLKELIHSINPKFQFGFYSGFSPENGDVAGYQRNRGHSIETLRQVGFDFVLSYCEGRHGENEFEEIEKVVEYLSPLPVYLHTTIRKDPPRNYPLSPKTPEYVKKAIHWGKEHFRPNDRFLGMTFFNEVKIPEENRRTVYESI